jgi:phenylacetate-coenzyme A ligase PaaK-like adenylate-forming protein
MICELEHKIFTTEDTGFEGLALVLFQFQYNHNPVYRQYVDLLDIDPFAVTAINKIPFLPIDFFKTHRVSATSFREEAVFESSGTTQTIQSRHFIKDLSIYKQSFEKCFQKFYGNAHDWCILGLLPSYLERTNSSLVIMVNELIRLSQHAHSGFYLYDHQKLSDVLEQLEKNRQKTLLIGVTFALLDFAENNSKPLKHTIVMETGGMKGKREEMTRNEVHAILKSAWDLSAIHSEYGMTELLSQAYSAGEGLFECPPWMKVILREEDDPLITKNAGRGLINVVDLANIYSCSFIATDDIGLLHPNGSFEVLGRRDNSDLRGCSLMAP